MNKLPHDRVAWFFIGVIFLFWFAVVWKYTRGLVLPPIGDYQRDTAIVFNILSGNVLGDAAYLGEHQWYPFLYHLLYALFHKVTGIPVLTLFIGYPFLITIPTILLFTFCVYKIFKSSVFTLVALFAFLFIIPGTSYHTYTVVHPWTLTYGTLALAVFLFWRAAASNKNLDWIIAGLGIAVVIYSQPYAAITICSGIVFYQLLTRRFWRQIFIMVVTSFVVTAPFILPFLTVYHLTSRNTYQVQFLPGLITLDNVFFGYGSIRWLNSFLILTGIMIALFRRNRLDRLILPMFLFGELFLFLGFDRFYGEQFGLPMIYLPEAILWGDMWGFTSLWAVFFFTIGICYWFGQISKLFHKQIYPFNPSLQFSLTGYVPKINLKVPNWSILGIVKVNFILLLLYLSLYGFLMLPLFIERSRDSYNTLVNSRPYSEDWMKFTDWVNKNTSINDVFLGYPDPTAYVFVSGMTGRKVISLNNDHVNPFIDQPKRINDTFLMYQTTDIEDFKRLARFYKLSYVVTSPYEALIEGANFDKFSQNQFFKQVFSAGWVQIYKLGWENEE